MRGWETRREFTIGTDWKDTKAKLHGPYGIDEAIVDGEPIVGQAEVVQMREAVEPRHGELLSDFNRRGTG